ncbi:PhzF family phenazine biosynthesis protein [Dokdonella sp.]|uniref:PhzF family phenazine biosynthesis protein n=1 Tax=Dokdonella sp. TaxID=2291710 RepID=UPI002F41B4EA
MNEDHDLPAPRRRRYAQVDVFTDRAGYGNPVAVVFDADDLDARAMQHFARWTNLSETTFVLAPTRADADFRLRIFTPRQELPFAGHPTVGTVHAVLEARADLARRDALVLECASGRLPVRIERGDGRRIFVQAPTARCDAPSASLQADAERVLGVSLPTDPLPRLVDVGARWLVVPCSDGARVRALRPDLEGVAALTQAHDDVVGLCVFGREHGDAALAVRAFCPADGIPEDPVTGSANAAIAAFLREADRLGTIGTRWRASQGREIGRDGTVEVVVDAASGTIEIGGRCVGCIDGTVTL